MSGEVKREWIEVRTFEKDGFVYHQCHCGRSHRCGPVGSHEPVVPRAPETPAAPPPAPYEPYDSGERVRFVKGTTGAAREGQVHIAYGETGQIIEDREMSPGRHRLFLTLDSTGEDVWVAASVVEREKL